MPGDFDESTPTAWELAGRPRTDFPQTREGAEAAAAVSWARRGLQALQLEAPPMVVRDLTRSVEQAFTAMFACIPDATPGALRIVAERARQLTGEGWTDTHDDYHADESLALAGAIYAWPAPRPLGIKKAWPWTGHWKPTLLHPGATPAEKRAGRIRDLEKAGALIAAEIDRLLRMNAGPDQGHLTETVRTELTPPPGPANPPHPKGGTGVA